MTEQQKQKTDPDKPSMPKPASPLRFDWHSFFITMVLCLVYYFILVANQQASKEIAYSEFKEQLVQQQIATVEMKGLEIKGRYATNNQTNTYDFHSIIPSVGDPDLLPLLEENKVPLLVKTEEAPWWLTIIANFLPWLLIFGFFVYSNRLIQSRLGGGNGMFSFNRSKARRYEKVQSDISFDEVAGLENAKQDLREVIDYLIHPEHFRKLGAKLPKGLLMMGPPGTGKTLLAKATAAEAGVPFFSISGSEFIEMFVGVGASRVRDMFKEARDKAPSLIFIDEIDSVGRVRGTGMGGGNDEREQTLNQILAEMDGFSSTEPVVILAATNRPDVLDPALLRPGRFDRKITLDLPQRKARVQILQVHAAKKPLAGDVDLDNIASRTIGFSGADLENLVNEAALHAARLSQDDIRAADFDYAHDRILLGAQRQDILGNEDRQRIAIHESGHAITSLYADHTDPLAKVTIIPRGRALGVTETMPKEDRVNYTEAYLRDRLSVMLGGRCAEQIVLGNVSSGAADDLKQCTQLARRMVTQFGMSEGLGPLSFPLQEEHPFLGMDIQKPKDFSEHTATLIDEEVRLLVQRCEKRTQELLLEHRTELDRLSAALIEHETLDLATIETLLKIKPAA